MHSMMALLLCAVQAAQSAPVPLVSTQLRQKLRAVVNEIAKTGDLELVSRMRAALVGLGDDEREVEKLARGWEKIATGAKPSHSTRASAAGKLKRELGPVVAQLAKEDDARRAQLARWIIELDCEQTAAQVALGHKREQDGEWLDAEQSAWKVGAAWRSASWPQAPLPPRSSGARATTLLC